MFPRTPPGRHRMLSLHVVTLLRGTVPHIRRMNQWAIGDMGARHKPRWLEKSADFDFLNTLETGSDHIHRRLFDPTVLFFLVGLLVARKVRPGGRRPGLGSGTDDFLNQTQSFGGLFLLAAFGSRLNGQSAVRASVEDCHP